MSIIPVLRSKELLKVLLKAGFKVIRQSGSHIRLIFPIDPTRQTTIPIHNADIPRSLLSAILKQAKISVNDLLKLLVK